MGRKFTLGRTRGDRDVAESIAEFMDPVLVCRPGAVGRVTGGIGTIRFGNGWVR